MKKLSLVLAGALLLGGISFASPVVKQQQQPAKAQSTKKPAVKPTAKPASKPAATKGKVKKGAATKNSAAQSKSSAAPAK